MGNLLGHLFRRAVTGTLSRAEERVLEFLANGEVVNRKVFGQPLAHTTPYYAREYLQHVRDMEPRRR